jgi:predicted ArsR family transcriptional regulator
MTTDEPTKPMSSSTQADDQLAGIAALGEPIRRDLYRFVSAQADSVSRDQAAEGLGVARHVAKFHLDKLVDDGLLAVEFARPPGRRGPGAGRPAKLYRRSSRELAVSLPPRDYELVGRLLARAFTDAERGGVSVGDALGHAARDTGRALGREAQRHAGSSSPMAAATAVLSNCGYEPRRENGGISLVNCPFHALSRDYTDLVCGMNLQLMNGLLDVLELPGVEARLEPTPGRCCVRLIEQPKIHQPVINKEE